MSVSRFIYVAVTGMVDLPSYLVPVILLRFTGRRTTTMSLFMLTGVALIMVLAVPSGRKKRTFTIIINNFFVSFFLFFVKSQIIQHG